MRLTSFASLRRSAQAACSLLLTLLTGVSAQAAEPAPYPVYNLSHPLLKPALGPGIGEQEPYRPGHLLSPSACLSRRGYTRFGNSKSPFVTFRAGLAVAPNLGFAGGIDFTVPSLSLSPDLVTRLDGDVLAAFNAHSFGGFPGTTFAFTVDQVYSPHWGGRYSPYVGAGIGPYWQESPVISGKVFAGVQFGSTVSSELDVHFPGHGAAIIAIEMRVSAL